MAEEQALLTVAHLKKYYPVKGGFFGRKVAEVHAVDDVSFSIRKGETLGLVGESGCGKSTLGRQIVRLEKPTAGRISLGGTLISEKSEKELAPVRTQIQMVFQDSYSSLNPRKRVFDILAEPMLYHHIVTPSEADAEVDRLLDLVGLVRGSKYRFPHEFSGGQRQRICIAKALALRPSFLVCDEPVSALDVSIQAQILNLFRDLKQKTVLTSLFIGHGLAAVKYVSDRVAVMYLGRIVEIADAEELFAQPAHPYTRALCAAIPDPDPNERNRAFTLKGEVDKKAIRVDAGKTKTGCLFASRCPMAKPSCLEKTPSLEPVRLGSGHLAACPVVLQTERRG